MNAKTVHAYTDHAKHLFERKLGMFHEQFETKLLACGVDTINKNIESVPMNTMFNNRQYLSRVIGGMQKFQPDIHVVLINEHDHKSFECVLTELVSFFPLDQTPLLDGVYLIQNAYDYPKTNHCLYQIWETGDWTTVTDVNKLWHATRQET